MGKGLSTTDPAGPAENSGQESEEVASGEWRSGARIVATGQAGEEEAEPTVIEKRQNEANLPMVLTIGRL